MSQVANSIVTDPTFSQFFFESVNSFAETIETILQDIINRIQELYTACTHDICDKYFQCFDDPIRVEAAPREWVLLSKNAYLHNNEKLKELLQTYDPNVKGHEGQTALHVATQVDNIEGVQLLLAKEADIDAADDNGQTPMHLAAQKGKITMVNMLKLLGADVNPQDTLGQTPLHLAAENGKVAVISSLITFRADIDSVNAKNQTPYYLACFNGSMQAAQYLRDMGADITIEDSDGKIADAVAGTANLKAYLNYICSAPLRDRILDM